MRQFSEQGSTLLDLDNITKIEAGLLGAAILEHGYISDLSNLPEDFFVKSVHNELAMTLKQMWLNDEPVDIATVYGRLNSLPLVTLSEMTADAISLNFPGDLQLLQNFYKRRKLKHFMSKSAKQAFDLSCDPDETIGDVIEGLSNLLESDDTSLRRFWEIANPMIIRGESGKPQEPGIPSGIGVLDKALGSGFRRGTMSILAARPSMGKSGLALQFATNAAKNGYKVLFISLEMSAESLMLRLAGSEAGIEPASLRQATGESWKQVRQAFTPIASIPLWICDDSGVTSSKAVALAKELKAKHGLDLVIVDYLQRFPDTIHERQMSRNHLIGGISKLFANLARQINAAVILVSQVNRRSDYSQDKKPGLSDLRDSGEIEQDADVVMLLWREGYYDSGADQTKAELILAKNREGPTGTLPLSWNASKVKFYSVDNRRNENGR